MELEHEVLENKIVDVIFKFYNDYELKDFLFEQTKWIGWCNEEVSLHFNASRFELEYCVRRFRDDKRGQTFTFTERIDKAGGMLYSISNIHAKIEETNQKANESFSQSL